MKEQLQKLEEAKREFPTVEDILQELNGAVKFSKPDMNHDYHQFELDADHILHTLGAKALHSAQLWNCYCTRGVS